MTNNRRASGGKITAKRLIIFLLLSFGMTFAMFFIYVANFGWTVETDWYGAMAAAAMLMPMIANILTRIITKEGIENLFLSIKPRGNVRYFAIALLAPMICGIFIAVFAALLILPEGSLGKMTENLNIPEFLATVVYLFGVTIAGALLGFGEEFGWRAYMTPKFEELFGCAEKKTKSRKIIYQAIVFLIGGTLWSLWHAPIIACGHNFGTDYPGYPWLGIGLMCISCICFGVYLTALTKASGSVLPAALAHMSINNICGAVSGTLLGYIELPEEFTENVNDIFSYSLLCVIAMSVFFLITGIIILIIKNKRSENKT